MVHKSGSTYEQLLVTVLKRYKEMLPFEADNYGQDFVDVEIGLINDLLAHDTISNSRPRL